MQKGVEFFSYFMGFFGVYDRRSKVLNDSWPCKEEMGNFGSILCRKEGVGGNLFDQISLSPAENQF